MDKWQPTATLANVQYNKSTWRAQSSAKAHPDDLQNLIGTSLSKDTFPFFFLFFLCSPSKLYVLIVCILIVCIAALDMVGVWCVCVNWLFTYIVEHSRKLSGC